MYTRDMHYLFLLIKILIALAVAGVVLGILRTWQTQYNDNQKSFLKGTVPNPAPDGLYKGIVPGYTLSWLGKKFDAARARGINLFNDGGDVRGERYPFTTSVGKGLRDINLDVIKIEYNIPGNPFWLRLLVDEIVEVAPGKYLGKLHALIVPGYPFALGYFELSR